MNKKKAAKSKNKQHKYSSSSKKGQPPTPKKAGYFSFKRVGMLLLSVLFIIVLYNVPAYKEWRTKRIERYVRALKIQGKNLDIEFRKRARYGKDYMIGQNIKAYFTQKNIEKPVLLLPPKKYLEKHKNEYDWGESLAFFYFTGIKPVHLKAEDINEATHVLIVHQNKLKIISVSDEAFLMNVIGEFKKYDN